MVRFKTFMTEGRYPVWTKAVTVGLVIKIRSLSIAIEREQDPVRQNKLIAQQNKLLSYISGLNIGVGTEDKVLLQRMKSLKTKF